jgi:hypothetical protein
MSLRAEIKLTGRAKFFETRMSGMQKQCLLKFSFKKTAEWVWRSLAILLPESALITHRLKAWNQCRLAPVVQLGVSPTKVRKVPQDSGQLPGRKGFSAILELPRRDLV